MHELVHYRFAYLGHGKKFEERVDEVLRGGTFKPKACAFVCPLSKALQTRNR